MDLTGDKGGWCGGMGPAGVAPKWCSRWRRGPAHVAFVFWELRPLEPMLPMRLFRSRPSAGITAILFHWAAGLGAILFMAQFLQAELGFGPFDALGGHRRGRPPALRPADQPLRGAAVHRRRAVAERPGVDLDCAGRRARARLLAVRHPR